MRKKQISILLSVVIASAMTLPMIGNVQASPLTVIEICPETTVVGMGESFAVDVNISDALDVYHLQFALRYDPDILEVTEVAYDPYKVRCSIDMECIGVPTVWDGYDCDVVPDGVLDVYDLAAIRCAFASTPGSPNWNPRADINKDGWVGTWDYGTCGIAKLQTLVNMPGTLDFEAIPDETLATVTFEVIGFGETTLDLDNTKLSPFCGEPIPHEARDGTVVVSPEETIQSMITTIESMDLPQGVENCLTLKLEAANDLLSKGNVKGAIHKLEDFIKNVEALRGKKLTDEQADYLVATAQATINALG